MSREKGTARCPTLLRGTHAIAFDIRLFADTILSMGFVGVQWRRGLSTVGHDADEGVTIALPSRDDMGR